MATLPRDANQALGEFVDGTGAAAAGQLGDQGQVETGVALTKFLSVAVAAAGNTAVWTPAAGKRFRLKRYALAASGNCVLGAGGTITVDLLDGTTSLGLTHSAFLPSAAGNPGFNLWTGWIDLGDGCLSAAAGNPLNANLSVAIAGGVLRVLAAGVEE